MGGALSRETGSDSYPVAIYLFSKARVAWNERSALGVTGRVTPLPVTPRAFRWLQATLASKQVNSDWVRVWKWML